MAQAAAHKLVAKTAEELANALYEVLMGDNQVRAAWKKQNPGASEKALRYRFVRRNTLKMLPQARATLGAMLHGPLDSALKDEIMEALSLDWSLKVGRGGKFVQATQVANKIDSLT